MIFYYINKYIYSINKYIFIIQYLRYDYEITIFFSTIIISIDNQTRMITLKS